LAASTEVVVSHRDGLHARPATLFAKVASAFTSVIFVENITQGTEAINAKSLLEILGAGVQRDDLLRITADGPDEHAAIEALSQLVTTNFGEAE